MDRLIDIHCHILPGVDDGAKDIEETKQMLRMAYDEGIRCIIATPHHHPRRGHASIETLKKAFYLAHEEARKIDPKFYVFPGTEVFFGQDIPEKLMAGEILTMNGRKTVLLEFSPTDDFSYICQGIQQVQMAGYEVIVAHAERYQCVTEDIRNAEHILDMGAYIQVNAGSITGENGWKTKRYVKTLMKNDMVFGVGTDAHHTNSRAPKMKKAAEYVTKKFGEEYTRRIFFENAVALLKKRREV